MSSGRRIRFVPSSEGVPLTVPWAFFSQADEFYASQAHLEAIRAKISFHSSGIWVAQFGPIRKKLLTSFPPVGNWISALHVHFLIPPEGATRPVRPISRRAIRVEVPQGHTFHIDLFVSREPPKPNADGLLEFPVTAQATTYSDTLRSGNILLMSYHVEPTTDLERENLVALRRLMPPLKSSSGRPLEAEKAHFELTSIGVYPDSGNHVLVTPTLISDYQ